jgi:hypothetical protein
VLSHAVYSGRLQRHRFKEICKASNFVPEASFSDIVAKEEVLASIGGMIGCNAPILAARAASADLNRSPNLLDFAASERLKGIFENAALGQADVQDLHDAIALADAINAEDHTRKGKMFLRSLVTTQLQIAVQSPSTSVIELRSAINSARDAGVEEEDLAEALLCLGTLEKGKLAALRKLRAAAAWVNGSNIDKLKTAISEAEQYGVDAKEIEKAKVVLTEVRLGAKNKELEKVLDKALHEFLEAARPAWTTPDLQAVKVKLARINIFTMEQLCHALNASGEEHLTQQLRTAGLKTFSSETLLALEEELMRRQGR